MSIVYVLASIRCDWLNQLCIWLSMLGEENFITIMGMIMLWCIDKKCGFRYFFMGCMSQACCRLTKGTFQTPRPYERDLNFNYVTEAEKNAPGYSMPSGHCQGVTNAFGYYAIKFKNKIIWIIALIFIGAVMFARMELGVHTLWDCIAGTAITFTVMFLYTFLFDKANEDIGKLASLIFISLMIMIAIIVFLYHVPQTINYKESVNLNCIKTTWSAFGITVGLSLGYLVDRYFVKADIKAPLWIQFIKVVIGIGAMLIVQKFLNAVIMDCLYKKAMVNGTMIFLFTGIYPMTFCIFNKFRKGK